MQGLSFHKKGYCLFNCYIELILILTFIYKHAIIFLINGLIKKNLIGDQKSYWGLWQPIKTK